MTRCKTGSARRRSPLVWPPTRCEEISWFAASIAIGVHGNDSRPQRSIPVGRQRSDRFGTDMGKCGRRRCTIRCR